MKNNKVKAIAEGAMFAALCTVLSLISLYVPFMSVPVSFICGIPVMLIFCRWGISAGICTLVCAIGVLMIMTGNLLSVGMISLMYIIPAAVFGLTSYKKMRFSFSVMIASVFVLIGFAVELIILNGDGTGIDAQFNEIAAEIGKSFENMVSMVPDSAGMNIGSIINDAVSLTVYTMKLYLPSIALISAFVIGYIISAVGIFFAKRLKIKNIPYIPFNMIKAPMGTIAVYIITFLITQFSEDGGIVISALKNLHLIATATIALSGFSFADFMLSKKIKRGYVRALIYSGVFIFGAMLMSFIFEMLVLFGIFDCVSKHRITEENGDDISE